MLPTPSDEPKTEAEEEAANEHFVKQMSETEPEYMGVSYMDARRMNNWRELLVDRLYEGDTSHDEIYCIISGGWKITGYFWFKEGADQFHMLYGGEIFKVNSNLYFLHEIHDRVLDLICGVETDEISIESQVRLHGYLPECSVIPLYLFDTMQNYCYIYELITILEQYFDPSYSINLRKYLRMSYKDLEEHKDCEKTMIAFCKNIEYLTEKSIKHMLNSILEKEGENNDNC